MVRRFSSIITTHETISAGRIVSEEKMKLNRTSIEIHESSQTNALTTPPHVSFSSSSILTFMLVLILIPAFNLNLSRSHTSCSLDPIASTHDGSTSFTQDNTHPSTPILEPTIPSGSVWMILSAVVMDRIGSVLSLAHMRGRDIVVHKREFHLAGQAPSS
jgi:hypothetical protein